VNPPYSWAGKQSVDEGYAVFRSELIWTLLMRIRAYEASLSEQWHHGFDSSQPERGAAVTVLTRSDQDQDVFGKALT